ncbi:MAG: hypothetical protein ACI92G_001596 [Candidatus Pelagisphaera sp.]|jgi:hypothetical protein
MALDKRRFDPTIKLPRVNDSTSAVVLRTVGRYTRHRGSSLFGAKIASGVIKAGRHR